MVLTLQPNSDSDIINFQAGQYVALGFKSGNKPSPMRCFSMASSPSDKNIKLAMRSSGAYTKKLAKIKPGTNMYVQGPFGEFTVNPTTRNIVMMSAGVGITPFMSILRDLTESKSPINAYLIYSSRNDQNIPFYEEINQLASINPRIKVLYMCENSKPRSASNIYTGIVNEELLNKLTNNNYTGRDWMICGPPGYMSNITKVLHKNRVQEQNIHSEDFQQGSIFETGITYKSAVYTYALALFTLMIGIGAVALKDVAHYFEKIQSTSKPVQQNVPSSNDSSNQSNYNDNSNSSTYYQNNTTNQTYTNTDNQSYQPPSSRVS